jgi:peptidoglycan lytic transglycosylase
MTEVIARRCRGLRASALTRDCATRPWAAAVALTVALSGCATPQASVTTPTPQQPSVTMPTPQPVPEKAPEPAPGTRPDAASQTGEASWYGEPHHGRRTASGEIFDMHQLTAAHRTLPLGTRVIVTNLRNGRSVEVRVNDRGPHVAGRIIDLSYAAARELGAVGGGTIPVRVRVLSRPSQ